MDVCALYAPSNPALVQKLMQQAMHLLPELQEVRAWLDTYHWSVKCIPSRYLCLGP